MAAIKKIRMRQNNEVDYDILYPETLASNVILQNYAKASNISNITNADDVTVAIGKLEKRVDSSKKVNRFVIGVSTAGWTTNDCDYLCSGTGDQTIINTAISALPSTGGEIIILDGTYNLTASINLNKSYVALKGSGDGTKFIRNFAATQYSQALILSSNTTGCSVSGISFNGVSNSYISWTNVSVYFTGCDKASAYNNYFLDGCGIGTSTTSNSTFYENKFKNAGDGIYLSSSNGNNINNNVFNSCARYSISFESSNYNVVSGNVSKVCGYGVYFSGSSYNAVNNNAFSDCNNYGCFIASSKCNSISNNSISNAYSGIWLGDSDQNSIIGNAIYKESYLSDQYSISVASAYNDYNIVCYNNCRGKAPVCEGGTGNVLQYNIS